MPPLETTPLMTAKYKRVYNLYFKPGEVVEIRAYGLNGKSKAYEGFARGAGIIYGYFDNPDDFAKSATALEAQGAPGIYFTLNPVNPDLLARAANRLKAADMKTATTADKDIVAIRWLPIDLDPKRPTGISSSKEELDAAKELGNKIDAWFKSTYQAGGIRALSGNGVHLTYKLPDLKPSEETTNKIKNCLLALQEQFGTEAVDIDCKVFNPARIWKLYGTTARKGDHIESRPHRKSAISPKFKKADLNQVDFIDDLASKVPAPKEPKKMATHDKPQGQKSRNTGSDKANNLGPVDIKRYLAHYGIDYNIKEKGNKTLHCLEVCLFDENHGKNDAAIVQDPSGLITYQCFHDSCRGNTWREARTKISGLDSLAQFCENYDPNFVPAAGGGSAPTPGEKKESRTDYISENAKGKILINRARLANFMVDKLSPIFHEGIDISDMFYRYKESGVWAKTPEADMFKFIEDELGDLATAAILKDTLFLLKAKVYKPKPEVTPDPMFLNLKNGMFDIKTQELHPHAPEYYSRAQLHVSYNPDADYTPWAKAVNGIHADDLDKVTVLQQFFGYCLYPGILFPCALIQIGGGGNGKGVVEHVLCKMLGNKNVSHISMKRMEKEFGPIEIKDKLLNSTGETETGTLEVTKFKGIAAGDEIQAEVKYKSDIMFTPIAKHMISTNDFPLVKDKTRSFYRRIIVMEYKQEFRGDDDEKGLKEKIVESSLDGVFMWALEGLKYVMENKKIDVPEALKLSKQRFKQRSNPVLLFVDEECRLGKTYKISRPDLYEAYKTWAQKSGFKGLGKGNFYEQIILGYGEIEYKRPVVDGIQASKYYFVGIRLQETYEK
jgi:P4 family phage/plasmid primase-like protien